jgi:hypothetical protein
MVRAILSLVLSVVLLSQVIGCIAVGGTNNQPTRGQELIDLKAALDRGSITQGEYESTKGQILNRH